MNDALGSSFTNRLNQATDGAITSTTYTTSSNDYVKSGTTTSNQLDVVAGGVEYKKLATDEKTHISKVSKDYAKEKGISEDEAYNKLTDSAMYAIDDDSRKDNAPITKEQQEKGFISATNERLEEINEDIAYLKDTSSGEQITNQDDFSTQDMFSATQEQFNDPDYNPDSFIGLESDLANLLLLTPVGRVTNTTIKGVTTVADDVILNTGIRVNNTIQNTVVPVVKDGYYKTSNKFLANPTKYTNESVDAIESALPGVPAISIGGVTGWSAEKIINYETTIDDIKDTVKVVSDSVKKKNNE